MPTKRKKPKDEIKTSAEGALRSVQFANANPDQPAPKSKRLYTRHARKKKSKLLVPWYVTP